MLYFKKGVREMCEIIERNRAEARAEERASLIISMLKNKLEPEQIAQIVHMTVGQIISIGKKAAVL